MKLHPPHADSEKKANALWRQFSRRDQEAFWKQYEPLITHHKSSQKAPLTTKVPTQVKKSSNRVFHPSLVNYFRSGIIISLLILLSFLPIATTDTIEETIIFPLIYIVFVLVTIAYDLWRLNSFQVREKSLVIQKKVFFMEYYIHWSDIRSIVIERWKNKNESYRMLAIDTYSNGSKSYKFPMSEEAQLEFISLLEAKNIDIKDESQHKSLWSSWFG
ncbi:hypothetical protein BKI52_00810 [marine bacterium AO1-C]|nr:hypothetical protein BKI52_00810 [marine bacterium AO1-C]